MTERIKTNVAVDVDTRDLRLMRMYAKERGMHMQRVVGIAIEERARWIRKRGEKGDGVESRAVAAAGEVAS